MAIYHLHAQMIGRGKGRSSVAAAAYRAACILSEEIIDKDTGVKFEIIHDYSKKHGVVFSKILAPENAPYWCYDREILWNKIQNEFETRKNSQFCRELDVALPKELSLEENISLLQEFVYESFVKEGMVADVNFHNDNPENPHAHIMLTTREIIKDLDGNSSFGKKVRHWNSNEFLVHTRRMWAGYINKHLELAGINQEVSHLSHQERGIMLTPTIKEGLARFIDGAERSKLNNNIKEYNRVCYLSNPELIIDQYFRDKTLFTKEAVAKVLFDLYTVSDITKNSEELNAGTDGQKSLSDYIAALDSVMTSDKIVMIEGRDVEGKQVYTTSSRFELEKSFYEIANDLKNNEYKAYNHNLNISINDLSKKSFLEKSYNFIKDSASKYLGIEYNKIELTEKQKNVVLDVVNSGKCVSVIEGLPGAGKTLTMSEVVRQYRKAGYSVRGCAVSSSAARELGYSSGIKSVNITRLRHEFDSFYGKKFNLNLLMDYFKENSDPNNIERKSLRQDKLNSKLTNKDVLIVDESSMVDLAEMHYILSEIDKSGAKLVLVGDSNQLPSVGTAGAAEKMAEMFGVSRLDEVRRQKLEDHRKATELLSRFKISEAIKLYRNTDVIKFSKDSLNAKDKLIQEYVKDYLFYIENITDKEIISKKIVLLAYTNKDISEINLSIREKLCEKDILRGDHHKFRINRSGEVADIILAAGDQIVFTRNSKYLGVSNSDVGEVLGFGLSKDKLRRTIILKVADSTGNGVRIVEVDNEYFRGFDYGYAINIYKSQGKTYNSVFGLVDKYVGYNSFNVMATRHKDKLSLHVSEETINRELYNKISLDPEQASKEYLIKSSQTDSLSSKYAGLVALIQRRVDTSFALDHAHKKHTDKLTILSDYIEVRADVIKLRQASESWLELERLKGRVKQFNETPFYEEIKSLLEVRKRLAVNITDNYEQYKNLMTMSKLNYNTIERHAGKDEFKYYFKKIDYKGSITEIEGFDRILDIQKKLSTYENGELFKDKILKYRTDLYEITSGIRGGIEEHKLEICSLKKELDNLEIDKLKSNDYIRAAKEYINISFNSYLSETFVDTPEIVLDRWEALKSTYGLDKAIEEVEKDCTKLGSIKGRGLKIFVLSKNRQNAMANIQILGQKLEKYEKYKDELPKFEKIVESGEYDREIESKELQLKELEAKLPGIGAQKYIEKLYKNVKENHQINNSADSINEILSWAKDSKVAAESSRYNLIFESIQKAKTSNKSRDNLVKPEENIDRSNRDYIKERNALLARYEYSRSTKNHDKLYRNIAGSLDPDLAYDILKNMHFVGISRNIGEDIVHSQKGQFTVLTENLSQNRIDEIKGKLLILLKNSISYDINEVEIISKQDLKLNSLKKSIEATLKNLIKNSEEFIQVRDRAQEYIFEYMAIHRSDISIILKEKIIERAIFEIENKKNWKLTIESGYQNFAAKGEVNRNSLLAVDSILIDKKADRLVSIESRLIQDSIIEGKTFNSKIIEKKTQELESTRDEKIKEFYKYNKNINELKKIDKQAGIYMAENLVDFSFKYGDASLVNLPDCYISRLKTISLEKSKAVKESLDKCNKVAVSSGIITENNNKVSSTKVISKYKEGFEELLKDNIHKAMIKEFAISNLESVDVFRAQVIRNQSVKSSITKLEIMQREYRQTKVIDIANKNINKSKSPDFEK